MFIMPNLIVIVIIIFFQLQTPFLIRQKLKNTTSNLLLFVNITNYLLLLIKQKIKLNKTSLEQFQGLHEVVKFCLKALKISCQKDKILVYPTGTQRRDDKKYT
jgi:hypothetical protein